MTVVLLVPIIGEWYYQLTAIGIAYGVAFLILLVAVHPRAEHLRAVRALLGTSSTWLLSWGAVCVGLLVTTKHNDYTERFLYSMLPLYALAAGAWFGVIIYTSREESLNRAWFGIAAGVGSGFAPLVVTLVAVSGIHLGDAVESVIGCAFFGIPLSLVMGGIWTSLRQRARKRRA